MKQVLGLVFSAFLLGFAYSQDPVESAASKGVPSGRIVNGTDVSIEKYPFIVRVYVYSRFRCAGSIISSKHALTAANCLIGIPSPDLIFLRGGTTELSGEGIRFDVDSYIIHPDHVALQGDSDLAIVTVQTSFAGFQNVAAIPLQTTEITYSPSRPTWCFVLGWGYTDLNTRIVSETLQLVWMQAISQFGCAKIVEPFEITSRMMCTRLPNTDICYGDAGGPVVCNGQLCGVISFGDALCAGTLVTINVKLSSPSIRSFIRENAGV